MCCSYPAHIFGLVFCATHVMQVVLQITRYWECFGKGEGRNRQSSSYHRTFVSDNKLRPFPVYTFFIRKYFYFAWPSSCIHLRKSSVDHSETKVHYLFQWLLLSSAYTCRKKAKQTWHVWCVRCCRSLWRIDIDKHDKVVLVLNLTQSSLIFNTITADLSCLLQLQILKAV